MAYKVKNTEREKHTLKKPISTRIIKTIFLKKKPLQRQTKTQNYGKTSATYFSSQDFFILFFRRYNKYTPFCRVH